MSGDDACGAFQVAGKHQKSGAFSLDLGEIRSSAPERFSSLTDVRRRINTEIIILAIRGTKLNPRRLLQSLHIFFLSMGQPMTRHSFQMSLTKEE